MAINSTIFCSVCRQQKMVCHSVSVYPDTCDECRKKIADDKRTKHLDECAKLTVEERLARIEAALYDMPRQPRFDYHTPIG